MPAEVPPNDQPFHNLPVDTEVHIFQNSFFVALSKLTWRSSVLERRVMKYQNGTCMWVGPDAGEVW